LRGAPVRFHFPFPLAGGPIPLRVSQFPACMIPVVPRAGRRVREAERAGASSIPEMQRRIIIDVIVSRDSL